MSPFVQYVLDIADSYKNNKINPKLTGCFFQDTDNGDNGNFEYITDSKYLSISVKDDNHNNFFGIKCYFASDTNTYYESDYVYLINDKGINISHDESYKNITYKNVDKDDYFNIMIGSEFQQVIDYNDLLVLKENLDKIRGIELLYTFGEEIKYGYS